MRYYGVWAGPPIRTPEDPEQCAVSVAPRGGGISRQCRKKRSCGDAPFEGLLCIGHAMAQQRGAVLYIPPDTEHKV